MKKNKIFIVDDDEDFAESMLITLEGRGYDVTVAHSGEEAIQIFKEKDFDIAFMDVRLPGKNGVESFMEIRKFKPGAKVIMMTGFSVEQLLSQAVENGAWGVLYKPIDIPELLALIDSIINGGILIADDDPDVIESIKGLLESKKYKVFIATNGKEAIEKVIKNNIDILILDLRMPVLDGLGAYMELRRIGYIIPTIIITAFAEYEKEAINALRSMSVSGILTKPFDPKELLEAVESITSK